VVARFASDEVRLGETAFEVLGPAVPVLPLDEVPCEGCGGVELATVGKKEGLTIRRCANCGLAFTSPRPRFEVVRQRYSADYFEREYLPEMRETLESRRPYWQSILDRIEPFKGISTRLLEVGCGAGYLLREAQARGWDARGIDLNPAAVAYTRSLGLAVDLGDIASVTFEERSFGAILLESVLEHFMHPQDALRRCASALHPGGGLFITTIGYEGDLFLTQGMAFQYAWPGEHLFYFSASSLARMCEAVGLRVESCWRDATGDGLMLVATRRLDA